MGWIIKVNIKISYQYKTRKTGKIELLDDCKNIIKNSRRWRRWSIKNWDAMFVSWVGRSYRNRKKFEITRTHHQQFGTDIWINVCLLTNYVWARTWTHLSHCTEPVVDVGEDGCAQDALFKYRFPNIDSEDRFARIYLLIDLQKSIFGNRFLLNGLR